MRYGVSRGVFSNEAGLGAAGNQCCCRRYVRCGASGIYPHDGCFIDTIVICSLTGLVSRIRCYVSAGTRRRVSEGTAHHDPCIFRLTFGRAGEWMLAQSPLYCLRLPRIIAPGISGRESLVSIWPEIVAVTRVVSVLSYGTLVPFGCGSVRWKRYWDFSDICNV